MTPIDVISRHPDFWVVIKPAGESFHSEDGEGFVQRLQRTFPEQIFYPVHRLDKMTSGIMLFATNKRAAADFGELFAEHQLEKRYLALSTQKPKKKQGTISGAMQPSRRGQWKLSSQGDSLAVTQFFSVASTFGRLFWVRPLTGKTHQIRVALKSLGSPILGDERYGGEASDRGYLHAYSLAFEWNGEAHYFHQWPKQGTYFSNELELLCQEHFINGALKWPKFIIPKR